MLKMFSLEMKAWSLKLMICNVFLVEKATLYVIPLGDGTESVAPIFNTFYLQRPEGVYWLVQSTYLYGLTNLWQT